MGQILRASLCRKHDGTMHQSNILRLIGQVFHAVMHRESDIHHIALLPLTTDGNIRRRTRNNADGLAIYFHLELTRLHPTRITHLQRKLSLTLSNSNLAGLSIGELSFLTKHHILILPIQL